MATIKISELNATGSDLFDDAETYLHELSERELRIQGGIAASCWPTRPIWACFNNHNI